MSDVWIIDACRTPRAIGKPGKGAYSGMHPQQLGAHVLRALAERNKVNTAEVDDVIWGCNIQRGPQTSDMGRMSALAAGYDIRSSGVTLDRFCGSGITSVNFAAGQIGAGFEKLIVAGGCEMMSTYQMDGVRPVSAFMDSDNLVLREMHPQPHQGIAADAIATLEGITREDCDKLALVSQQRADHAIRNGYFNKSLIPVYRDDGTLALDHEEFPRPQTTLEALAELKPAFTQLADMPMDEKGTTYRQLLMKRYPDINLQHIHTAGNSSGVADGAGALLLASPDYAMAQGWKPRARIVSVANMGDDPTLMLNAPVNAAKKVLKNAGLTLADIDLFEINEAFAVVAERFIRHLDLDRDKVNVNGGAIALGHPIGATGAILIGTALDELERRGQQRALITMCTGGGMAPAIIIERI
jgi:acetyl-CoA C-acetyltransferase